MLTFVLGAVAALGPPRATSRLGATPAAPSLPRAHSLLPPLLLDRRSLQAIVVVDHRQPPPWPRGSGDRRRRARPGLRRRRRRSAPPPTTASAPWSNAPRTLAPRRPRKPTAATATGWTSAHNVIENIEEHPLTGIGLGVALEVHRPLAESHDRRYVHVALLWYWLAFGPRAIAYLSLFGRRAVARRENLAPPPRSRSSRSGRSPPSGRSSAS